MENNVNTVKEPGQFWHRTTRYEPWHRLAAKGIVISLLSVAVLGAPQSASAWQSFNGMEVNKVNDNVFEVFPKNMDAPNGTHYWCAAAEFAEGQLRAKSGEIYVVRGLGPAETANRNGGSAVYAGCFCSGRHTRAYGRRREQIQHRRTYEHGTGAHELLAVG